MYVINMYIYIYRFNIYNNRDFDTVINIFILYTYFYRTNQGQFAKSNYTNINRFTQYFSKRTS